MATFVDYSWKQLHDETQFSSLPTGPWNNYTKIELTYNENVDINLLPFGVAKVDKVEQLQHMQVKH